MEGICPVCGAAFSGRPGKIYCSDKCRSNNHNWLKSESDSGLRDLNGILVRNRRLLSELFLSEHRFIRLKTLVSKGFCPECSTSSVKRLFLPTKYFCYEFSYYIIPAGIVRIRKIDIAKYGDFRYL